MYKKINFLYKKSSLIKNQQKMTFKLLNVNDKGLAKVSYVSTHSFLVKESHSDIHLYLYLNTHTQLQYSIMVINACPVYMNHTIVMVAWQLLTATIYWRAMDTKLWMKALSTALISGEEKLSSVQKCLLWVMKDEQK